MVLGCRPGPALDARVAAAAWLWRAGLADRVVVSGAGEAAAGAARLRALGVPADAVVVEGEARDTWENLVLSAALVGRGPWWVVSDRWHLPRALRFAAALGIEARAWPVERAVSGRMLAREGMAVVYGLGRR
ncbi:MAG: YdcF family protein [bacterium]